MSHGFYSLTDSLQTQRQRHDSTQLAVPAGLEFQNQSVMEAIAARGRQFDEPPLGQNEMIMPGPLPLEYVMFRTGI